MGLDAVGSVLLTNQPSPPHRPSSLHPRLTIALANEVDRKSVVRSLDAAVITAQDLWDAAVAVATQRSGDRVAARSRVDAAAARAVHDLETAGRKRDHLDASQRGLLDGAAWVLEVAAELPSLHGSIVAARAALERCEGEERCARHDLERVLEQRAAAAAAVEEADEELADLGGGGMDELGLRRELQAAGEAVRVAQEQHAAAVARVAVVRAAQAALDVRRGPQVGGPSDEPGIELTDPSLVDRVREWLITWIDQAGVAELDPQAQALAEAWADLLADLAELPPEGPRPSAVDLQAADERVLEASERLRQMDSAVEVLSPAQRAAIDAAHDAVLAADDRTGRRFGAAAARRQAEELRATEEALLRRHGFGSYLEVVLSGGRASSGAPERTDAERALFAARAERDTVLAAMQESPDAVYLRHERSRLHAHTVALLGVDPGEDPVALLSVHPLLPQRVVEGLRTALEAAGVVPVGVGLAEAAARWVDAYDAARDASAMPEPDRDAELVRVAAELAVARQAEAQAEEQLELARRGVDAFEAELTARVGADADRVKRFTAAEALRAQVVALTTTLDRAEGAAQAALSTARAATTAAEAEVDRAIAVLADRARAVRELAGELPIAQRPEGDPLADLEELAHQLRAHAEVLAPEIHAAEETAAAAAAEADRARRVADATPTGLEGPLGDDLRDGLGEVLLQSTGQVVVLDEAFTGVGTELRPPLLEALLEHSMADRIVLLTEDPDLLGWAIELPADAGTAVPADALITDIDLSQPTADLTQR